MDRLLLRNEIYVEVLGSPVIMKNLLTNLSGFDHQRLRKVSRGIRECIDFVKPDPQVKSVLINGMGIDRFDLIINLRSSSMNIAYCGDVKESTFDVNLRKVVKCSSEDSQNRLVNDLNDILRNQKAPLQELRFEFSYESYFHQIGWESKSPNSNLLEFATDKFLNLFREMLASRKLPLQVETLFMETKCEEDVLRVLPYIDAVSLKTIDLQRIGFKNGVAHMQMDKIPLLEQWKNSKYLKTTKLISDTQIQRMNIFNFKNLDIHVNEISSDDILYVKENLLKHQSLIRFKIDYVELNSGNSLYDLLGPPNFLPDDSLFEKRKTWYYRIPESEEFVLYVLYYLREQFFIFCRIPRISLDDDIVIQ